MKRKATQLDYENSFVLRKMVSILFGLMGLAMIASAWLVPELWRPTKERDVGGWMGVVILVFAVAAWKYLDPFLMRSKQNEQPDENEIGGGSDSS